MTPTLIIDCSITMSWCFEDEACPASARVQERLADETALVPAHWALEVANVLVMAERRKRITVAKATEFAGLLGLLEIELDHEGTDRALEQLLPLCRSHKLTSYDAAYLELALRRGLPLATLDTELRSAAKRLGVPLVGR